MHQVESFYLAEVRRLPRPSEEQVDEFVEYVSSAHSWYKHLPLYRRPTPFLFYLNPNAGREWIRTGRGGGYRDRTIDTPPRDRFHYTWQPTVQYLERLGYLDYYAKAGTSFLLPVGGGVLTTESVPRILAANGEWIDLPDAIRTIGVARLTASIHPRGQDPYMWVRRVRDWDRKRISRYGPLPDDELLAAIVSFVRKLLKDDSSPATWQETKDIETILLPADAFRQKIEMGAAIRRVLQWVYDA